MRRSTPAPLTAALVALTALHAGCDSRSDATTPLAGPLVFPDEPFRSTPPELPAPRSFSAPDPERFTLPSGLEVVLFERRSLPLLRWYIVFPAGPLADPPGKEGLASLCINTMFQGSRNLDRAGREQALADVDASVDVSAGAYELRVSGDCLRPDLDAILPLWADLFQQPGLTPTLFAGTVRARIGAVPTAPNPNPTVIAGRVSARLFWGTGHPMLREPTRESFAAITLEECQAYAASLGPTSGRLFIAGDISRAEVEATFGSILTARAAPAGQSTTLLILPAPSPATGSVYFVDAPGSPQSIISLRSPGPARTSPEYFPAQIMVGVLAGNSTTSRIGLNVREMRGYAYSINGSFVYDKVASYFDFWAPVSKDATAESVFEVLEEVRKMRETDVSDEELARERDALLGALPYQFETIAGTLSSHANLIYFGLPGDYFKSYTSRFAAVTKESVRQIAERYLRPGQVQILVVGDSATVLPELRELAASRPDLMGREVITLNALGNPL